MNKNISDQSYIFIFFKQSTKNTLQPATFMLHVETGLSCQYITMK